MVLVFRVRRLFHIARLAIRIHVSSVRLVIVFTIRPVCRRRLVSVSMLDFSILRVSASPGSR